MVVTGGELTLEQLDLQWDPSGRMYQAPPQLKAAGGVLVVDDLGRQRVPVRDLNRQFGWELPEEEAATVAGLVIHHAQRIPAAGQAFTFNGFHFDVLRRKDYQLTLLKVRPAGNDGAD